MFREKTHHDRAKRMDLAANGATKGPPKIARAKCLTNPVSYTSREEKDVSEGLRGASETVRGEARNQNYGWDSWFGGLIGTSPTPERSGDSKLSNLSPLSTRMALQKVTKKRETVAFQKVLLETHRVKLDSGRHIPDRILDA